MRIYKYMWVARDLRHLSIRAGALCIRIGIYNRYCAKTPFGVLYLLFFSFLYTREISRRILYYYTVYVLYLARLISSPNAEEVYIGFWYTCVFTLRLARVDCWCSSRAAASAHAVAQWRTCALEEEEEVEGGELLMRGWKEAVRVDCMMIMMVDWKERGRVGNE